MILANLYENWKIYENWNADNIGYNLKMYKLKFLDIVGGRKKNEITNNAEGRIIYGSAIFI